MEGRDLKLTFPSPAEALVTPLTPEMPLSCLRLPCPETAGARHRVSSAPAFPSLRAGPAGTDLPPG